MPSLPWSPRQTLAPTGWTQRGIRSVGSGGRGRPNLGRQDRQAPPPRLLQPSLPRLLARPGSRSGPPDSQQIPGVPALVSATPALPFSGSLGASSLLECLTPTVSHGHRPTSPHLTDLQNADTSLCGSHFATHTDTRLHAQCAFIRKARIPAHGALPVRIRSTLHVPAEAWFTSRGPAGAFLTPPDTSGIPRPQPWRGQQP